MQVPGTHTLLVVERLVGWLHTELRAALCRSQWLSSHALLAVLLQIDFPSVCRVSNTVFDSKNHTLDQVSG